MKAVKFLLALVAIVAIVTTALTLWINDRRDDYERKCAERGGVAVSDYPEGRICIKAERIPID